MSPEFRPAPEGDFDAEADETFRDELASVARDGRRRWVYARQPSGPLYRARTIVGAALLGFLVLAPFISTAGQPLMLLNVLERRFVILGVVFRPQDFYLVVLLALTVLVTLVLSTVVVGRIWCGWLCPQTVFMEMVFRRLEYLIEGSAERQLRRDRAPWTTDKTLRKVVKHGIFLALSFGIANVFLAWIIGAAELRTIVTDPPAKHLAGLVAILMFSSVFYLVFARFREQACVLACPYGRMMSSLIDARTITVTYDAARGEPRGRLGVGDAATRGDCVDCHRCVTVCPTGIDIRHGLQLECIACTACIDACNDVMRRVNRPAGLIRHTSADAVRGSSHAGRFGPRARAYAAVWVLLVGAVTTLLATRPGLDVLILRQPGTLYATVAGGDVANFYTLQALNRTSGSTAFEIDIVEPAEATVTALGPIGTVAPYGVVESRLLVRLPLAALAGPSTRVRFVVRSHGQVVQEIESAFLGPASR